MKPFFLLAFFIGLTYCLSAQQKYTYTIKADSVRLTGCDSTELIIENHSQAVPGFLYNTGHGRTIFKRGLVKVNDTSYLIGPDSLHIPNAWVQGGNAFGGTGQLGTKDNNHIDFYTNSVQRGRWTNGGNLLIGTTVDSGYPLQVNGTTSISDQLRVGTLAGGTAPPASLSGATIITQGQVRATGGFNLREPVAMDNTFTGLKPGGVGAAIWVSNSPLFSVGFVQGSSSGSQISIASGFNPTVGNGTVNVLDFAASGIQMLSGSNTITYNFMNLAPGINQGSFGTGITRGLFINPSLVAAADWRSIETVKGDNRLNTSSGNTGIGLNSAPTSKLDLQGTTGYSQFRMRTSYTPTATTDTNGNVGDFSWDGNYFYIKTPAGWKRSALTTF